MGKGQATRRLSVDISWYPSRQGPWSLLSITIVVFLGVPGPSPSTNLPWVTTRTNRPQQHSFKIFCALQYVSISILSGIVSNSIFRHVVQVCTSLFSYLLNQIRYFCLVKVEAILISLTPVVAVEDRVCLS